MTTMEAPPAAPTTFLWLEITGRCQLECKHCYADSSASGTHGTMTMDDWLSVIDQGVSLGVRTVQFIGGEPTLHPGLPQLVRHAVRQGLDVEVFSNLVHVSEQMWEVFSLQGVRLATSYYSDDADQHAAITSRPTYERTRANIAEALRRGIRLRAGVIDMGAGQRVQEARADLVELGVPQVGYDRLRQIGRGAAAGQGCATELCGQCGDGVARIGPDGQATPCIMSRWASVGDVRTSGLSRVLDNMSAARAALHEQGMPPRRSGPAPCQPQGDECYPSNCHPR